MNICEYTYKYVTTIKEKGGHEFQREQVGVYRKMQVEERKEENYVIIL